MRGAPRVGQAVAAQAAKFAPVVLTAAPLAIAIFVFGTIFGAAASVQLDGARAIGMSLLVFSGALQFTVIGLLASGAGAPAIIVTAIALNARHVVLAAVLRPRLQLSTVRRALLGALLLDESFGLAVAARERAAIVLLVTGALLYVAWQAGTLLGAVGAQLLALADLAAAIFPVLFIGLAAVTMGGRRSAARTLLAGALVLLLSLLLPDLRAFLPIVVALIVALPGGRRP